MSSSPIFLISGTPGAGKSTVAAALMRRFPFGLHIPLDDLREWVVSGIAHPVPEWTRETARQFQLARESAAQIARRYADAGFAVAMDDVIFPSESEEVFSAAVSPHPFFKVLLRPRPALAVERNRTRSNKSFNTNVLAQPILEIAERMARQDFEGQGWLAIDNSELTVDETVDRILEAAKHEQTM